MIISLESLSLYHIQRLQDAVSANKLVERIAGCGVKSSSGERYR